MVQLVRLGGLAANPLAALLGDSDVAFSGASISLAFASAQTIENNATEELIFLTDDFDVGSWIDNTTNKRFKIPSGVTKVLFSVAFSISSMTAGILQVLLKEETRGTVFITNDKPGNIAGSEYMVVTFPPIAVVAGEVFYIDVFQNGGASETIPVSGVNDPARFVVVRLG